MINKFGGAQKKPQPKNILCYLQEAKKHFTFQERNSCSLAN